MKVSFRQRIQQLQQAADVGSVTTTTPASTTKVSSHLGETSDKISSSSSNAKKEPPKSLSVIKCGQIEEEKKLTDKRKHEGSKKSHKPFDTIPQQIVKPSTTTPTAVSDTDTPIKPWSKLKLATIISSSYTSLATSNTSSEDGCSPQKIYSLGSIPLHVMSEETLSRTEKPPIPARKRLSHDQAASSNGNAKVSKVSEKSKKKAPKIVKEQNDVISNQTKLYQSVFDLSPEYSGLPFVKRLKILNERQKLAELEKALQTRSFSLDSSKTNNCLPIAEALYRCHSDTSNINSQFLSAYESSSTTSTNTSTSERTKCSHHHRHHRLDTVQHDYAPLSPESNETIERRKLKSILKKISNEREQEGTTPSNSYEATGDSHGQCRGLPMEPTVEGYVARHSKLFKSVTFNSTLSSPPGSVIKSRDNAKEEHQSVNTRNSPTTTINVPPFYVETVRSPPDLLRAESIASCSTANCSQSFQLNSSSSTLTLFPTGLYPQLENNHSSCPSHISTIKGNYHKIKKFPSTFNTVTLNAWMSFPTEFLIFSNS